MIRRDDAAEFVDQLGRDHTQAQLNPRDRAIANYAAKLTRTPAAMTEDDLAPLRAAELSDKDILEANLTVSYFAFVNRIADGLGVQLERECEEGEL